MCQPVKLILAGHIR